MLILVTESFPFGGEPFLEEESQYLKNAHYFALASGKRAKRAMDAPAFRLDQAMGLGKLLRGILAALFSPIFWEEMRGLGRMRQFHFPMVKHALHVFSKAWAAKEAIKKYLRKSDQAGPHTFYSYWMMTHALTCALLKEDFPGSFFVTRAHGYDLYRERSSLNYLPFRDYLFRQADLLAPVSDHGRNYLLKNYPQLDPSKVQVHHLGSSRPDHLPTKERGAPFRLVSCSSILQVKRLDRMVDLLSKVQTPLEWIHIGTGPLEGEIRQLAQEKLAASPVTYRFLGQMPHQDLLSWYGDHFCDLFLNVSQSEGIPVSIMEASSFGIPVLATDVGGTAELVQDGKNGKLLAKDFLSEEAAAWIQDFLALSEAERKVYRDQARARWEESFSAEGNYAQWAAMLEGEQASSPSPSRKAN